jgi:RNA polymerase sigma-70 factor (ECF subfamily)
MIRRLGRGYEADPGRRRDLLQDIHLELWQSLELFDGRCALRTWVYRIAHNVAASHIVRQRRIAARLVDLEALDHEPAGFDGETQADHQHAAQKLLGLIHQLRPSDRQIILLYLEGETAAEIAEVTGLSSSNIATKIHRIKKLLQQQYIEGKNHD